MRKLKAGALLALGSLLLAACGNGATTDTTNGGSNGAASGESVTLNSVTMVLPNTPNAPVVEWFYSQLEERSEGRITIDRTEPESICKAPEIAECVRDGRADIGVSISDYSASLFPSLSIAGIPFLVDNPQALMQALYEVNTTNESAKRQWEDRGIEFIAAWSPGTALIGSNDPIESIADLKGVKIRAIGASLPSAYDMAGAGVVSMPAAEMYENLERGVADAVSQTIDGPVDYKLMEILDSWTDPGAGAYTTFSLWMNAGVYNGLPDDLKAIVDEVREELNTGAGMEAFNSVTEAQCTTLLDFPNTKYLGAWSEEATKEWKDLVQEDLIEAYLKQAAADGLEDPQSYFDAYVEKLEALAAQGHEVEDPVTLCIERFENK